MAIKLGGLAFLTIALIDCAISQTKNSYVVSVERAKRYIQEAIFELEQAERAATDSGIVYNVPQIKSRLNNEILPELERIIKPSGRDAPPSRRYQGGKVFIAK